MKTIPFTALVLSVFIFFSCGKKTNEASPQRKDITETVFASGTLEPENKYNLTAQSEGYIIELRFNQGDVVSKGQVLAVIDNKTSVISLASAADLTGLAGINASADGPALKQAKQNAFLMYEKFRQDSLQYSRYQKLFQSNSVSKLELENSKLLYETSRTNFLNAEENYRLQKQQADQQLIMQRSQRDVNMVSSDNNEIKAVVGGKVYKKLKEIGDYVRRGDVIAVIGDAEQLYAKLNVDESNIANIKLGQDATVQLNTQKGMNYEAKIYEILPAFDDASQSFICKAKFERQPELRISGTQLQANIITGSKSKALVIPRKFLDFGNKVLLKGNSEPVVIKTGFVSSEWVEVLEGLTENDILINQNR